MYVCVREGAFVFLGGGGGGVSIHVYISSNVQKQNTLYKNTQKKNTTHYLLRYMPLCVCVCVCVCVCRCVGVGVWRYGVLYRVSWIGEEDSCVVDGEEDSS